MNVCNATPEGIYDALMRALVLSNTPRESTLAKIVGFGDGASVNTGIKNGVIALLRKRVSPEIVMIKCMSHRVELAFKDAMKVASLFTDVHDLLDQLFKFYHRSPKQMNGLKETLTALELPCVLPIRVGGTRWITHTQRATENMMRSYKGLVMHLSPVPIVY